MIIHGNHSQGSSSFASHVAKRNVYFRRTHVKYLLPSSVGSDTSIRGVSFLGSQYTEPLITHPQYSNNHYACHLLFG